MLYQFDVTLMCVGMPGLMSGQVVCFASFFVGCKLYGFVVWVSLLAPGESCSVVVFVSVLCVGCCCVPREPPCGVAHTVC